MLGEFDVTLKRHRYEPDEFCLGSVLPPVPHPSGSQTAEEAFDAADIVDGWVTGEEPYREASGGRQFGQGSRAWLGVALFELAQGCGRQPASHGIC